MLQRLRREILARLSLESTDIRRQRLGMLLADINQLSAATFGDIDKAVQGESLHFATSEVKFNQLLLDKNSTAAASFVIPSDVQLVTALSIQPMNATLAGSRRTIDAALKEFGLKKSKKIVQIINDGVLLGDPTPDIAAKVAENINTVQMRQVETLVRTITNHTSSVARDLTYQANSDLIESYEWVATLDGHTTLTCAGRDGKTWEVGKGPLPPAHWGCRSTTVPNINSRFSLAAGMTGQRPANGAGGPGVVSGKATYGGWLRKQPASFQDQAIGPERARLFRSGKLTIDKFTDPTGEVYTLAQLEQLHPMAFQ